MELKIFFNEQPLYLCDELSPELEEILKHPDAVFLDELSVPAINTLLHEVKKEEFHAGVILHKDFDALKKLFFKQFEVIEAAGGVVQNEKKEVLFIFRRGRWDLPKGKLDEGETIEHCAEREIAEETGLKNLALQEKVCKTYHVYKAFGKEILKISHWYFFTVKKPKKLTPQTEEDITEAKWFSTRDIKTPMANTFPSIKDVLNQFFDKP